ncbi:MAG: DNA repair protein RadC [Chitinophagales bacterium]|nr:DNA repair protein RadC [Chitinophagales bacterium]MDW8427006.1 DNA repair protein RadC [Chitinophagales bacterium]
MSKKLSAYAVKSGIKSWAEEDRPREKLLSKGVAALSDTELIAILLRTGSRDLTAVDTARQLLSKAEYDLDVLARMTVTDLMDFGIKGLGLTKAITLVAALELGRRRQAAAPRRQSQVKDSKSAFELLAPYLSDKAHEEFWIMLLNQNHRVLDVQQISIGGLTGTVADVRKVFEQALKLKATAIILVHNHPSGNLQPSGADVELTRKMKQAGATLDIRVLDHLIIADKSYYSFADEGML